MVTKKSNKKNKICVCNFGKNSGIRRMTPQETIANQIEQAEEYIEIQMSKGHGIKSIRNSLIKMYGKKVAAEAIMNIFHDQ